MRILLCVDDDPVLEDVLGALERFLDFSRWHEILVLHVVAPNPLLPMRADLSPGLRGEGLLERVERHLRGLPIPVRSLLSAGEPPQEIARIADDCDADLVVMGARGERREFLMGSVSQRVVSLAPTDVLVVRESAGRRERRSIRAVLAVDGSPGSEAGIEAFARKLRARGASIHVVHVVEAIPPLWDVGRESEGPFFLSMESRAREVLARARELLVRHGLPCECGWRRGSPAAQILDAARESSADVIVVGSRGHSAIRNMVLGSVTHRVLRHAPCSVLCARGWAPESDALSRGWSSESWKPEVGMA